MSMMIRRHKTDKRDVVADTPSVAKAEEKSVPASAKYSKTDINRMGKAKLIEVAEKFGIADAVSKSGNEIKKALIDKLNL